MKRSVVRALFGLVMLPIAATGASAQPLPTESAALPADFAWTWPIHTGDRRGAFEIVLDVEVYGRIRRNDLRDLAAFNGGGQMIPLAPRNNVPAPTSTWPAVDWLAAPTSQDGAVSQELVLRLRRDPSGSLRELHLDNSDRNPPEPSRNLLIDLGERPPPVATLQLEPADTGHPIDVRVNVLESDDLSHWRSLAHGLALVALTDGPVRIERLRLDFPASRARYLRLMLVNGSHWPDLVRIAREQRDAPPVLRRMLDLTGEADGEQAGRFVYRTPGPVPIDALTVRLHQANSTARVRIEIRERASDPWRHLLWLDAYRLDRDGGELLSPATTFAPIRASHWRLSSEPALAVAPTLEAAFQPDTFVLLTEGEPPYLLAAGSVRSERPMFPIDAALTTLQQTEGPDWQPERAAIGPGREAGGAAALRPDTGPYWRAGLLWAVLVIGAILVAMSALRLLRRVD